MIQDVTVTNPYGDELTMTLTNPEETGIIITDITGLGPGKCNVNMTENSPVSGTAISSVIMPERNITMTLMILEGADTVEEIRLLTYKYFPLGSRIRLDITTEAGVFYIYGYVESNEPVIFSQKQTAAISIVCPDPAFRGSDDLVTGEIDLVDPLFEFPFSNLEGTKSLEFSRALPQATEIVIPFEGTVNVGPKFRILAAGGDVIDPAIYFRNPNDPTLVERLGFKFTTALPRLKDGDYLQIDCEKRNKSVVRYDSKARKHLNYVGAVSFDSSWPILHPGDNYFSYDAYGGAEFIMLSYEYTLKYAGI